MNIKSDSKIGKAVYTFKCQVDSTKTLYELFYRLLQGLSGIQHLYLDFEQYDKNRVGKIEEMEMQLVKMPRGVLINERLERDVLNQDELEVGWSLARLEHVLTFLLKSDILKEPKEDHLTVIAPGKINVSHSGWCDRFTYCEVPYVSISGGKIHLSQKRIRRSGESFEETPRWEGQHVLIVRKV